MNKNGDVLQGDKIRVLSGPREGQEASVVDVYDNPRPRVRVRFPDNTLEILEINDIEVTEEVFDFMRWASRGGS